MADGAVLRAPLVISDAGALNTFARLLPRVVAAQHRVAPDPRTVRPSIAHLCLYIGLRHTAEELGLPKANFWIYPDERHEQTFARVLAGDDGPLPAAYISFPSAKDPDFARRHPGRAAIDVITLFSYDAVARWADTRWKKRPEEYDRFKEGLTQRLLALLGRHVPQIEGKIDTCELSTPLTTRHFANYTRGEIYGLDHTPARFRERLLRPRTPIRGLFLTGQDVASAGVAGALMGGVLSASAILHTNLLGRILREARTRNTPVAAPAAALSSPSI
jgi:all-trans-retinol 13,14-reductase